MWRTAVRNLLAHRSRLVMSLVAVLLGASFVAATMIFSDSLSRTRDTVPDDVAVLVAPKAATATYVEGGRLGEVVTERQRRALAAIPGVTRADGVVTGFAGIVGSDGKVARGPGFASDSRGTNWTAGERVVPEAGRPPAGPGEVAVETTAAHNGELAVGDRAKVLTSAGSRTATVVGIYTYRALVTEAGGLAPSVAFDSATAQRMLLEPGAYSQVEIHAGPGSDAAAIRRAAAGVIPQTLEAEDGAELTAAARAHEAGDTEILRQVLGVFAALAVIVGSTLIANTFAMLVAQRTRELALQRAVGATRRQVRRSIIAEAAVIGAVGGLLGLAAGALVAWLVIDFATSRNPALGGSLAIRPLSAALTILVSTGIAVLAAWLPARRAAAVPPVEALRSADTPVSPVALRRRTMIGTMVAAVALLACLLGSVTDTFPVTLLGLCGALVLLVATVALAPTLAGVALRPLRSSAHRRGAGIQMAVENALRNRRRTGATASALLVGIALASAVGVFASSMTQSSLQSVGRSIASDYVAYQLLGGQIGQETRQRVERVPGVETATTIRTDVLQVGEDFEPVSAIDPAALGPSIKLELRSGSAADLAKGAFVTRDLAEERGWRLGSPITVRSGRGGTQTVPVAGMLDDTGVVDTEVILSNTVADRHFRPGNGTALFVNAEPGTDGAALMRGLRAAVGDRPDVKVNTTENYIRDLVTDLDVALRAVSGLLAVSILIAFLGVTNTLALSVIERTREIGLLRAIGMTRRQIQSMIRVESVLITVIGGLLGMAVGLLIGTMAQHMVLSQAVVDASIPYLTVAGALAGLIVVGVLAAAWPARTAARTDVLRAIAME